MFVVVLKAYDKEITDHEQPLLVSKLKKMVSALCFIFLSLVIACVAGVQKGGGRELGRETTREGGGRRGMPARKPLFSPSRLLLIKKITKITKL